MLLNSAPLPRSLGLFWCRWSGQLNRLYDKAVFIDVIDESLSKFAQGVGWFHAHEGAGGDKIFELTHARGSGDAFGSFIV